MLLTRVAYLRGSAIPRMRITKTPMLQAKAIRSRTISASPLRVTSHPLETDARSALQFRANERAGLRSWQRAHRLTAGGHRRVIELW